MAKAAWIAQQTDARFVRELFPVRKRDTHKGDYGKLLIVGGSVGLIYNSVNYGIMFLGYAASTWISQPITAVLYHAEAGSAAYQQSFYIAVVLTVYMMVSDSKKKSA